MNSSKLLSGRVLVTPYDQLSNNRREFLGLSQAEPNLGPGDANSVLTLSTGNTRVWSNSLNITDLQVSNHANLGSISNVKITGGSAGQSIVTDGAGNLTFQSVSATSNRAAPMPYNIPVGESYIVNENFQGLFAYPITIDGELEVDGMLIEIGVNIDSIPGQVFFDNNGNPTGNAGFTFDSVSGNFAVPGNSSFSGNLLPGANIVYNLGSPTQRWKDLYLSNTTIYLGESTISASTGNITLVSASGAAFEVSGNANVSVLQNGNSNIAVTANGNITTSVGGTSNVFVVTSTGANVNGTLNVTGTINLANIEANVGNFTTVSAGNVKTDTLLYSNGQPWDLQQPGGNINAIQFNKNDNFGGSDNFTFSYITNTLTLVGEANITGNISVTSNISAANISGTLTTAAQPNITSIGTLSSLDVTGNVTANIVKTNTLQYANGQPWDLQEPAGSNTQIQFNNNSNFGASANLTFDSANSLMTLNGNLAVGNVSGANVVSANYLVSQSGCVAVGAGIISVTGNTAGIFNSSVDTLNIGLGATTITIGSPTGNVNIRGNVIASNVVSSGLVNAQNVTVGDLYSSRAPVSLIAPNTVIDQFLPTQYRSAKYTIKASNDAGFQALEVLLVHDSINSIMTVYGSLSTTGNDIVTLSTVLDSGYVKLLATGVAANTVVNLMGTYVPD